MSTPNTHSGSIEGKAPGLEMQAPAEQANFQESNRTPRDGYFWLNRAFYIIGAIAGVGCIVVLIGAYVIPKLSVGLDGANAVLAGTLVIVLAVSAWIATTVIMVVKVVKDVGRTVLQRRSKRG